MAVDPAGNVYVTAGQQTFLRRLAGESKWTNLDFPVFECPRETCRYGDWIVQTDSAGRLWVSALAWERDATLGRQRAFVGVAISHDQGDSWNAIHALPLLDAGPGVGVAADRNWLTLDDANGLAYLTYFDYYVPPYRSWVAVSPDTGQSWSAWQPMPGNEHGRMPHKPVGQPAVTAAGTFIAPSPSASPAAAITPSTIDALVSHDGGATFQVVQAAEYTAYASFFLAAAAEGDWAHIAYTADGGVWVVSSQDEGRTWNEPVAWGTYEGSGAAPWIVQRDGLVHVAWYQGTSPTTAMYAQGPPGQAPTQTLRVADAAQDIVTDHAHLVVQQGTAYMPVPDGSGGLTLWTLRVRPGVEIDE